MDYEKTATELLRVLRGKRSRPRFSRFLGYRSNIAQRWESGHCWPTASNFFAICTRLQKDPRTIAAAFLRRKPAWLQTADLTTPLGVAAFFKDLRGTTRLTEIARRSGYNRYSVARWLGGQADPRLPEFLVLIESCSRRVIDFLSAIVDPSSLPSVAVAWSQLKLQREGALSRPLSHAVLRALELDGVPTGQKKTLEYLSQKTGLCINDAEDHLKYLVESGQVETKAGAYRPAPVQVVDTGGDYSRARDLRLLWARIALERLEQGAAGIAGYSVFAISREDLRRIRQLQVDYLRQVQGIIAQSSPSDCVALYCAQLLDLSGDEIEASG